MKTSWNDRLIVALPFVAVVLLCAAAVMLVSCSFSKIQNVLVNSPSQVTEASPAPGVAPSPAGSTALCPLVATVRVNPFGFEGCSQSNSSSTLPVGCTGDITATPLDAQGNHVDVTDATPIAWNLRQGAGVVSVNDWSGETYNKRVTGLQAGTFALDATVCGQTGTYAGEVK